MRCADCLWWWKEDCEKYPRCHCEDDALAPCEEDEDEMEKEPDLDERD